MRELKNYYSRLVDCQELAAFMTEDGVDVFGGSAAIKTCLNCGHTELPSEVREIIDSVNIEKRKTSLSPTRLHVFSNCLL
jgi:hypothetical protein